MLQSHAAAAERSLRSILKNRHPREEVSSMSNTQIVVVEDEAIVAKNIELELISMGYAVAATAASGEEALQKVAQVHPDLVLMDIALKGSLDGVQTAEQIQERFDVPIIYLSAYADEQTLQRAKKTGPFGYLLKPYEEKELQTTIEIALHKHKTEVARREVQQWLAAMLRCIGDAVIATDARGCISLLNPSAEVLTGWSQDEALGKELLDVFAIVNSQTHAPLANPATRALREGKGKGLEEGSLLLAKNGKRIPVEGSISPVYDEHHNFTGFVAVLRHTTMV